MSRLKELRQHLSYANVVATLALVIAVAGIPTAVAVTNKPGKNTVTSKSIKRGNVTARDLADVGVVLAQGDGASLTATCEPNEKLLGGGGAVTPAVTNQIPNPALRISRPEGNGWVIGSHAPSNATAYALCLSAKPTKRGN